MENVNIYVNGNLVDYSIICNYNKMIQIGKVIKGEKYTLSIEAKTAHFKINGIYLYYENSEVLKENYKVLSRNQVDLKQISRE